MKYFEIQQMIDTMEKAGYDYKSEIGGIETNRAILESGAELGLNAHVKALILSCLSNEGGWEDKISTKLPQIAEVFCQYDRHELMKKSEADMLNEILTLKAGNRQIKLQIAHLKENIRTLERIDREKGGIDNYYATVDKYDLLDQLSNGKSEYKLKRLGVALVCEYLKGVGINLVKPDRHVCRLIGRLKYSKRCPADEIETLRICDDIAKELSLSQAMVDTILWQYCADHKFSVCTATPNCAQCGVHNCPSRVKE